MTRKTVQSVVAVLAALLAPVEASAAEMKWRNVSYATKGDAKPVGDAEGHVTGTWERHGLCLLPKEVGVYEASGTFDVTKGKGSAAGTVTCTFDDGSSYTYRATFNVAPGPKNLAAYSDGRGEFVDGTGRFEGIKGTSSFTGRMYTPTNEVTKGDAIIDGESKYTVTKKPQKQK